MKRITLISVLLGMTIVMLLAMFHKTNQQSIANLLPEDKPTMSLKLEIANTPEKLAKGLEGVKYLPEHSGMMFVFEQPAIQCMWNRPVNFPIDVAFLTEEGVVVNVDQMAANSERKVCSVAPVKFVVETNVGTFVKGNK